ncbi:conserved hypothetical protein [Hyella patelloides LEGE 07179]|uniref:Uncharacterized protein n=1 Tax=Hyella patelloides LEGE 07179 TaxID=945734 RepID=A0A563VRM1_9CYAN|nr:hypothetical protein [Hyella patelloides]VEP14065.1 conserved hypothetical protein [Hyella patelloides LEGE 07179]
MFEQNVPFKIIATQTVSNQESSGGILSSYQFSASHLLILSNGGFLLAAIAFFVIGRLQYKQLSAKIKYEQNRVNHLQTRLHSALETISKWEKNPDLVHSRDCNLDYIRMRMEEEQFNHALVTQVKVKIKQFISTALRLSLSKNAAVGIAHRNGFTIDETFDITYETDIQGKLTRRVLFRIQVKLMKLPTQSTSSTVKQIIDCIEAFLSPGRQDTNWQPTIQGHIVNMNWNQQAKPTPLLSLEQDNKSVSVSFRTKMANQYRSFASGND